VDALDVPDHGRRTYESNGIRVVQAGFDPAKQQHADAAVAPAGGPNFPALEDVQISSTPT
jgi:hypothetical protein